MSYLCGQNVNKQDQHSLAHAGCEVHETTMNTAMKKYLTMTIGSCRAYFQLRDIMVSDLAGAPIRNFLLNFNDAEVTGIATVDSNCQLSTLNSRAGTPCRA